MMKIHAQQPPHPYCRVSIYHVFFFVFIAFQLRHAAHATCSGRRTKGEMPGDGNHQRSIARQRRTPKNARAHQGEAPCARDATKSALEALVFGRGALRDFDEHEKPKMI